MARAIDGTKATKEVMEYSRKLHEAGNVDAAGYVMWAALIVDNQPTIDPVKHGKWIEKTWHSRGGYRYLKCECGKEHCIEKPIDDIVDICSECGKINEASFRNYCPNCGARMDGE